MKRFKSRSLCIKSDNRARRICASCLSERAHDDCRRLAVILCTRWLRFTTRLRRDIPSDNFASPTEFTGRLFSDKKIILNVRYIA